MPLILTSPAFVPGAAIPRRHTGDGEDLSPPLSWTGIPKEAKSLVILVDDPDAPSSEPWVHWLIAEIPAAEPGLAEGVPPIPAPRFPRGALQGKNSWGTAGYRGPAPPRGHGVHRYGFHLYALSASLKLAAGFDKAALIAQLQGHVLAEARLMGTYQRA